MIILSKAIKIAVEKVFSTIFNIVVFRNVYSFVQIWLSGIYAFIAVIYITPYVKGAILAVISNIRATLAPKSLQEDKLNIFNKQSLNSVELNTTKETNSSIATIQSSFLESMKTQSQIDLFSYIFTCSSKSSLLNLATIIGVEYVHSNYEYNIVHSILYCVSITFVICFGSSLRYSSILSNEWVAFLQGASPSSSSIKKIRKEILITYEKDISKANTEFVCLWTSNYNEETKMENIELKFLSSKYSSHLKDLVEYYVENHLILKEKSETSNLAAETMADSQVQSSQILDRTSEFEAKHYTLLLPDYYDDGMVLTNMAKKIGFKNTDSWKEFNIFPLIDIKIHSYTNYFIDLKNKKKTN